MIVWQTERDLRLTLQTDHMEQVGDIGLAWYDRFGPGRHPVETVLAARRHDAAWREWEIRATLDPATGLPYHFSDVPRSDYLAWYHHAAEATQRVNAYAGVLVSMHASGLRMGRYGVDGDAVPDRSRLDPAIARFVTEEERRQRELLSGLGVDEADVWDDYRALQAWDRLSIFLCSGRAAGRILTGDGTPVRLRRLGALEVAADPFPFVDDDQEFPVRMRCLPKRRFASDEELHEVLANTPRRLTMLHVMSERRAAETDR